MTCAATAQVFNSPVFECRLASLSTKMAQRIILELIANVKFPCYTLRLPRGESTGHEYVHRVAIVRLYCHCQIRVKRITTKPVFRLSSESSQAKAVNRFFVLDRFCFRAGKSTARCSGPLSNLIEVAPGIGSANRI